MMTDDPSEALLNACLGFCYHHRNHHFWYTRDDDYPCFWETFQFSQAQFFVAEKDREHLVGTNSPFSLSDKLFNF